MPQPRLDMRGDAVEVSLLTAEKVGLRERYQVEMPVEKPHIFEVSDEGAIPVIQRLAENKRYAVPADRIDVPLGIPTNVDAAIRKSLQKLGRIPRKGSGHT